MASKRLGALLSLGLLVPAAFAGFDGGSGERPFDLNGLLREFRAREKARATPSPEGEVWVSFSPRDLADPKAADFPLASPVATSAEAAVFRVKEDRLGELSDFMHERFNRCGGFFAHSTREQAQAALSPTRAAVAPVYTLDQQAWTAPLMAKASEPQLRSTLDTLAAYHNRYYTADTGVQAARWIAERWKQLAAGIPGASAELVAHPSWKQSSAVLTIPGAETPEEIVVLGGHLDSIGGMWGGATARAPGVDDNASGIAVLTEAIRILGEAGFKPKRTVQFMGYAAEEVGLRGSQEIARAYAQKGKKVVGVIQFDMTNFRGSEHDVYLLEDNVNPELTAFLGKLLDAYVGAKWSKTKCGYGCSDHASWTKSGFPASAAFESSFNGMNKNIHTDRDTLANSGGSAAHSVNFAKLAVAFAAELAKQSPASRAAGR